VVEVRRRDAPHAAWRRFLSTTTTTAECLGVSEEVVKTRLSRARARLRDGLYERAGAVAGAAFTFGAERCDRVVAAVLTRLRGEPA
jgi:RNA polymerase sigma-70 factor (ECF subfamily)